uniref:Uncharacterized protein n=1 Tax=Quercus lobata TaxID=97700 RepID=A0A7N2LNW5_QUELO
MVAYFTTTPPDSGSTHHITSDLANVTLSAEETIGSDQVYFFNNSSEQSRDVDLMNDDQCHFDDSQLGGATPAATEDASKAAVELMMMTTKTTTQSKVEPPPLPREDLIEEIVQRSLKR